MNFNLSNALNKLYKNSSNVSAMLLYAGIVGWASSSAAQVCAILFNKNIPNEQKKFLIPQEIYDALLNMGALWTTTKLCKGAVVKLVASGKITTPKIERICQDFNSYIQNIDTDRVINNFGKFFSKCNLGKSLDHELTNLEKLKEVLGKRRIQVNPDEVTKLNNDISRLKEHKNIYNAFEGGIGVIGTIVGSIISCNILTPLFRNPLAARRQKLAIAMDKHAQKPAAPDAPTLPILPRVSLNDYKNQVTLKTTIVKTNSSMKV